MIKFLIRTWSILSPKNFSLIAPEIYYKIKFSKKVKFRVNNENNKILF